MINGGSVNVSNFSIKPVNNYGDELYRVELTIPGQDNKAVTSAGINGVDCSDIPDAAQGIYGINGVSTDNDGKLYFYLPLSDDSISLTVNVNNVVYETAYQKSDGSAQTMEPVVTSISVTNEPVKIDYIEGEALDLTEIVVRLNKSGGSEDVDLADFSAKGITTSPANGEQLSLGDNTVTVTYAKNSKSYSLNIPISVIPRNATISPTSRNYDLNSPADISTNITWNANNNITVLSYGTNPLSTPVDYVVTGDTLTIKDSYINGLGVSE